MRVGELLPCKSDVVKPLHLICVGFFFSHIKQLAGGDFALLAALRSGSLLKIFRNLVPAPCCRSGELVYRAMGIFPSVGHVML